MRLIRTSPEPRLEEFADYEIPPYAILSHRWGDEEVSFQDMQAQRSSKRGYSKISRFCDRAAQDGFAYAWIDTCCINKESSAELSEAINSMFRWYKLAAVCYAYLADVPANNDRPGLFADFKQSQWFDRGWTLQELLAPSNLVFLAQDWTDIGWKHELSPWIHEITGIDESVLVGSLAPQEFSIAKRMSWASGRVTTRIEDLAYCLMGIFNVNMPLLYGEGDKAFIRLQEEIMKDSDDQTLFAWEDHATPHEQPIPIGFLAQSPVDFQESGHIIPFRFSKASNPFSVTNRGVRLHLPLVRHDTDQYTVILECHDGSEPTPSLVGIQLMRSPQGDGQYIRVGRGLTRGIPDRLLRWSLLEDLYVVKSAAYLPEQIGVDMNDGGKATSAQPKQGFKAKVSPRKHHKKLILCFDAGQAKFSGAEAGSNILQIYRSLDRTDGFQFHHYQPGIARSTDFESYVMSGYKFLMRYYDAEDQIFLFGFSEGAYAAWLLADMIHRVGVLSASNEAMVHLSWAVYQDWLFRPESVEDIMNRRDDMDIFRDTFCKPVRGVEFLGLFDTVIPRLKNRGKERLSLPSLRLAKVVRHAVAVDERRAQLRSHLLGSAARGDEEEGDVQEVWFAGCHNDIGGGWPLDATDDCNLSLIPLVWMIREAESAGLPFNQTKILALDNRSEERVEAATRAEYILRGHSGSPPTKLSHPSPETSAEARTDQGPMSALHEMIIRARRAKVHDSLDFNCGMGFRSVLLWRIMEYIPLRRMDLQHDGSWKLIRWPLPRGEVRDIPDNVRVHGSAIWKISNDEKYRPGNLIIGGGGRGVRVAPKECGISGWSCVAEEGDLVGEVWSRKRRE